MTGVVVLLAVAGVATAVARDDGGSGGDRAPGATTSGATDTPSPSSAPTPAEPGAVLPAAGARVPSIARDLAMAARRGGVRVTRLGAVDGVDAEGVELSAPEGGRLLGFRLADWPCGGEECRTWAKLGLQVDVDGTRSALPGPRSNDTFVVAVPAEASTVDLVLRADGLTQTLSLLEGTPGADNIAVLARRGRVDAVGDRFTMLETSDIAFDYGDVVTRNVPRSVTVSKAELTWFDGTDRPGSTDKAFLKVSAHYTIPYGSGAGRRYAFEPREMTFVGGDGTTYRARDLDPGPGVDAVFEVPATLQRGTLVLGGDSYAAQSSAGAYTRTLPRRTVSLSFG